MLNGFYAIHNKLVLGKKRCTSCKGKFHSDALIDYQIVGKILTANKVDVICQCHVCGRVTESVVWIRQKEIRNHTLGYCVKALYES